MEVNPYRAEDRGQVLDFLARQFPESPQKADGGFFRWRFERNPLGSSLGDYLLAWHNGEIIGQMGGLRERLHVAGQWRDCLWLVDLIVAPEHRGGLAALSLFRAAMRRNALLLAVGAGPNLLPLYKALGWKLHPVAGTYFSVSRLGTLLRLAEDAEGSAPAIKRFARLADAALEPLQRLGSGWPTSAGLRIEEFSSFNSETDALLEELTPLAGITSFRSASLLNWKFLERPQGSHFLLSCRKSGRLRGYAAVKLMRRGGASWGEITDIMTHPGEPRVFRALLSHAIRRCRTHDTGFVRFRCSLPQHTALLKPPFWIRRNRHVIDDVLYYTPDRELSNRLATSPWHLTSVVSDRTDHGRDEWGNSVELVERRPRTASA